MRGGMTDAPHPFKPASGLTGFVQRMLGIHPLIAAGLKYAVMGGMIFGAIKAWEHGIRKDERVDITVEAQAETIESQSDAAETATQDRMVLADGNQAARDTERANLARANASLAEQLDEERKAREALETAVRDNPCLRVAWPDELRVDGGRPIARAGDDGNPDTRRAVGGDDGPARLRPTDRE